MSLCVTDLGWKIPTRLYGAILHGEFSAAYVFPAFLPGGTNVTIEASSHIAWLVEACNVHLVKVYFLNTFKFKGDSSSVINLYEW